MPPSAVENGDFEEESISPWVGTNVIQTTERAYNGNKSITRDEAGNFVVEQDVSALNLRFDQILELNFYVYSLTASVEEPAGVTITITFTDDSTYQNILSSTTPLNWVNFVDLKPGFGLPDAAKIVKKIKLDADAEVENVDFVTVPYAYLAIDITPPLFNLATEDHVEDRGGNESEGQTSTEFVDFANTAAIERVYGGTKELFPSFNYAQVDHHTFRYPGNLEYDGLDNILPSWFSGVWDELILLLTGREYDSREIYDLPGTGHYLADQLTITGLLLDREGFRLSNYYIALLASQTMGENFVAKSDGTGAYSAYFSIQDDFWSFINALKIFAYRTSDLMAGIDEVDVKAVIPPGGPVSAATVNLIVDLYKMFPWYSTKGYLLAIDSESGDPIRNLMFIISDEENEYKRTTDNTGRAAMDMPEGTYNYTVWNKDGRYEKQEGEITTDGAILYLKRRTTKSEF